MGTTAGHVKDRFSRGPSSSLPVFRRKSKESIRIKLYIYLFLFDATAIIFGFGIANLLRYRDIFNAQGTATAGLLLPLFFVAALNNNTYALGVIKGEYPGLSRAFSALVVAVISVLVIGFFAKAGSDMSRLLFCVGGFASAMFMVIGRKLFQRLLPLLQLGQLENELLITDGVGFNAGHGIQTIDAELESITPDIANPLSLDRLGQVLKNADRVVIACPPERRSMWATVLKGTNVLGELLMPELDVVGVIGTSTFEGMPTVIVSYGSLGLRNRAMKRTLDLALVVTALIALLPILILAALAVKIDSAGPILFAQSRLGQGNRLFKMYKFRSMRVDMCDDNGSRSTARNDDRVTRVGRFLRATSLDELPQLFNILLGEMSIVGPRPHALGSLAGDKLFWEIDQRYWHRHASKPGLTGLAQVRGFRGATVAQSDLTNRLQADLEYLNGWSIWKELSIIVATLKVLVHRNAY